MRSIAVNMVCGDVMHSRTAWDLVNAVGYQIGKYRDNIILNRRHGTLLAEERQELARSALEAGAEWLVFVDSDMRFPKDVIHRLLAHEERVVAANCSKRRRPVGPTARRRNMALNGEQTEAVWPDPDIHGLEQVETVGFGLMCIKADVFHEIEYPWFHMPWVEAAGKWMGEDVYFCGRCREAGIPIYIDHDLSWEIAHSGVYEFGMRDVLAERALTEQGAWEGQGGD